MPQSWRSALLLRRAVSRRCYSGSVWFEGMMALRTRLIFCLVLGFICRLYILQASQSHSESWQQFFLVEILNVCFNIHSYCIDLVYFLCLLMCIKLDIIGPKREEAPRRGWVILQKCHKFMRKRNSHIWTFFKNELINKPKMDKKNSQTANLSLLRHKLSFFFLVFLNCQTLEEKEVKWSIKK